eukprot:3835935-Rhodomonas_salina.1
MRMAEVSPPPTFSPQEQVSCYASAMLSPELKWASQPLRESSTDLGYCTTARAVPFWDIPLRRRRCSGAGTSRAQRSSSM